MVTNLTTVHLSVFLSLFFDLSLKFFRQSTIQEMTYVFFLFGLKTKLLGKTEHGWTDIRFQNKAIGTSIYGSYYLCHHLK